MKFWQIRLGGFILMIIGGFLFVWAVRDITAEWPQIFTGLLSVFCISMGFGILIMPGDSPAVPQPPGDNINKQ